MGRGHFRSFALFTALVCSLAVVVPVSAEDSELTLDRVIPHDVFLLVNDRPSPQCAFITEYWMDVYDALCQSGVGDDLLDMFGSMLGQDQMAEVERLRQRAMELIAGVDWDHLGTRESAFAERMSRVVRSPDGDVYMGPPDMVFIWRDSAKHAAANYGGMKALLAGALEEMNNAAGNEYFVLEESTLHGAKVAQVDFTRTVTGAPSIVLGVAQRGDLLMAFLGEQLRDEVLSLCAGEGIKPPIGDKPHYQAAFRDLPGDEDGRVYFDVQAMMRPFYDLLDAVMDEIGNKANVYVNNRISEDLFPVMKKATDAYQRREYAEALAQTKKAHEISPGHPTVMYNLACFNALCGNEDAALDWLNKAVAAGFYAPGKIKNDPDLRGLHDDPRFQEAVDQAAFEARLFTAGDVVLNSSATGAVHELNMRAWKLYEQEKYAEGLKLVQQAYELAPNDSRVLYYLACFYVLNDQEEKGLEYLQRAVERGFYCPQHVARDPDLEPVRDTPEYKRALRMARENAAEHAGEQRSDKAEQVRTVMQRLLDVSKLVTAIASVHHTEGYSTHTRSIVTLSPDAQDHPLYQFLAGAREVEDFDRYLPQETESFAVSGSMPLEDLYTFILDTLRDLGPDGAQMIEQWEQIQKQMGFSIKEDLLAWIDGASVSVTFADGSTVWMIKVHDGETARQKVMAGLEFAQAQLGRLAAENPMLAMLSVTTTPTIDKRLEGFENLHIGVSPQPVVWGVADDYLIFGSSAEAIATCLATGRGEHPNIRKNSRLMAEALIPSGPCQAVMLTDQRKVGKQIAEVFGVMSMMTGMMGTFIPDREVQPYITKIAGMMGKLTPVALKIDFIKSSASLTTFDGKNWHTHQVTHYFPPSERPSGAKTAQR